MPTTSRSRLALSALLKRLNVFTTLFAVKVPTNQVCQKIHDKLKVTLGARDAETFAVVEYQDNIYTYPKGYGHINFDEMDRYSLLIVVKGEVAKDTLNLFGIGYRFETPKI